MAIEAAPNPPQKRRANKAEVAEWFEVSLPTVDLWIRRGCPVVQRGSRGISWVLDLKDVAEWRFGRNVQEDTGDDGPPRNAYDRLHYYKAVKEQISVERELGQLVPAEEVRHEYSQLVKAVTQSLDTLPDRLEREAGLDARTIELVEHVVDSVRSDLYAEAVREEDAREGDSEREADPS